MSGFSNSWLGPIYNRIINGDMRIDQRNAGASQTFTAAAAIAYCVDRFYGNCTGANVTGQQVAGTSPDQFAYKFTGAASVTAIVFGQRIERTNIYDLVSTTATFSVGLANSLLTTVTWTAYYPTANDDFTAKTQIATGTFTVSSTMTQYSVQIALGANITAGLAIELSVGAQTSGTWQIENFSLVAGTTALPFEREPIQQQLALCQRYYQKSYPQGSVPGASLSRNAITNVSRAADQLDRWTATFLVVMRAIPTIVVYSTTGASGNVRNLSAPADVTCGTSGIDDRGFVVNPTANTASGSIYAFQFTASAEL